MPSAENYLDIIAASYRGIHESTQVIAQATQRLEATQRGLARLQGFAFVLMGFCLLFTGYIVWQHLAQGHEHAALMQGLIETLNRLSKP